MPKASFIPNKPIPDTFHVLRYVSKTKWCPPTPPMFPPSTFISERNPDDGISVFCLEYFQTDESNAVKRICETATHRNIKRNGRFLKIPVNEIRKIKTESQNSLQVIYTGSCPNKSHSDIIPPDRIAIAALCIYARKSKELLEVPPHTNIYTRRTVS